MAKIKFNVKNTEYGSASDFEDVEPGVYRFKIVSFKPHKKKGERTATSLELVVKPFAKKDGKKLKGNYGNVWKYIGLSEASEWLYAQVLEALGIATKKKRTGEFDPEKQVGKVVLGRIKAGVGADGKSYKPELAGVFPLPDDEDEVEEEEEEMEDEDESEDESDEEEESEDADEDDESDEDEDDEEDEEDEDEDGEEEEVEYSELSIKELRDEVVGRKLLKKAEAAKKKSATLIRLLEEDDAEAEEEEEDEEVEDEDEVEVDDEEEEEADYSELSIGDLRAEVVERGLLKKKEAAKKKSATLIKLLEADDVADDEEDEDDDDEPPF